VQNYGREEYFMLQLNPSATKTHLYTIIIIIDYKTLNEFTEIYKHIGKKKEEEESTATAIVVNLN